MSSQNTIADELPARQSSKDMFRTTEKGIKVARSIRLKAVQETNHLKIKEYPKNLNYFFVKCCICLFVSTYVCVYMCVFLHFSFFLEAFCIIQKKKVGVSNPLGIAKKRLRKPLQLFSTKKTLKKIKQNRQTTTTSNKTNFSLFIFFVSCKCSGGYVGCVSLISQQLARG